MHQPISMFYLKDNYFAGDYKEKKRDVAFWSKNKVYFKILGFYSNGFEVILTETKWGQGLISD